eukprot:GHVS01036641.1.p1 GENE.GHVS01036641.1~~GHVS01036641.1.p1  ORF type:complete len:814 (+),score=91.13 GHVS01036641.1:88-2442(+)
MLLVFSLQPNEINAFTSLSPELQQFRDFLVKYTGESKLLSDCSEIYWLFSNDGAGQYFSTLKTTAIDGINGAFVGNSRRTSVKAENVEFIGSAAGGNDIVRLTLTDGNECSVDVDVDVGPRLMGGPETRKDMFKELHPLIFSESPVRKQMINFACRLGGKNVSQGEYVPIETFPNIVGKTFNFNNRFQIKVISSTGTFLLLQDGVLTQEHHMMVDIANLNSGEDLWTTEVQEVGIPLKVEEFSEEQDKLFDDFQKQLLANVESQWGAYLRYCHQQQQDIIATDVTKVTTLFNAKGTDDKLTVVTTLFHLYGGDNGLEVSLTSVVSRDQDAGRPCYIQHLLYITSPLEVVEDDLKKSRDVRRISLDHIELSVIFQKAGKAVDNLNKITIAALNRYLVSSGNGLVTATNLQYMLHTGKDEADKVTLKLVSDQTVMSGEYDKLEYEKDITIFEKVSNWMRTSIDSRRVQFVEHLRKLPVFQKMASVALLFDSPSSVVVKNIDPTTPGIFRHWRCTSVDASMVSTGTDDFNHGAELMVTVQLDLVADERLKRQSLALTNGALLWEMPPAKIVLNSNENYSKDTVAEFQKRLTANVTNIWNKEMIHALSRLFPIGSSIDEYVTDDHPVITEFNTPTNKDKFKVITVMKGATNTDGQLRLNVSSGVTTHTAGESFMVNHTIRVEELSEDEKKLLDRFQMELLINVKYLWSDNIYNIRQRLFMGSIIDNYVPRKNPVVTKFITPNKKDMFKMTTKMKGATVEDGQLRLEVLSEFTNDSADIRVKVDHFLNV